MLTRASWVERALVRPWLLVAAVVLLIGVPVLATGELGARDAQDRLHRSTITATGEAALRAAAVVDLRLGLIKDTVARVNTLPFYLAVSARDAPAALELITAALGPGLRSLGIVGPYITRNVWVVDAAGQTLATLRGVGVALPNVNGHTLFDRAAHTPTGIGVVSSVFVTDNVRFEQPFVLESPFAVEPMGDGVTFAGALIVQIHASALGEALKPQLGPVEDVVIFDGAGRLVSRASDPEAGFSDLTGASIVQQALSGKQVLGDADDPFGAGRRVVAVAPVGDSGWRVAAIVGPTAAEADLADSLAQQRTVRLVLFAVLLLGTYAFARVLSGSIRRRRALAESLERESATSEILNVVSQSTSELQPVFDIVVERSLSLCNGDVAWISRVDAGRFHNVAFAGSPEDRAVFTARQLERPEGFDVANDASIMGMVLRSKAAVSVPDLRAVPTLPESGTARRLGVQAVAAVPMLRGAEPIGAVIVGRKTARPFSEREVALLRTFADQSVIAIENVRLFNETKEALRQQTATAEVLRSISRATFDLPAVLQTLVDRAAELCEADQGWLRRFESQHTTRAIAVTKGAYSRERVLAEGATEFEPWSMSARVLAERRSVQIDTSTDPFYRDPPVGSWHQLHPNPDTRPHTFLGVPMMRDGTCIGLLLMLRNVARPFTPEQVALIETFADQAVIAIENVRLITEIQEKSRELEIAGKHKSEFLANMSHELRTPLNAIIGFADVLGQKMFGELNEKQSDYLGDIGMSGRHLLDLVNQILDLSKIEAGRMDLEPTAFSPAETIRASLAFVRERAAAHRIELAAEIPADLPTVTADERKIRQVLLNLLSNAVKFTPDGGRIGIAAHAADGELEISVKDTGIGIPIEDQPAVFEEFRQVGQRSDRSREGTGLGLTLAKRFVELHGGRIWVESSVGKGSTFTFAIPVERPAAVVAG